MKKPCAYLVYECYGERDKPLCAIVDNSIEEAMRKIGGTSLGCYKNNEFRIFIPLKSCQRGINNMFYYINGTIRLEIDSEVFTGGVLALVEVPLFRAAS